MIRNHTVVLIALLSISAACSTDHQSILSGFDRHGVYIQGVPFVAQDDKRCGPAALAGVSAFWGRPADPAEIAASVYNDRLGGTLPMDMERYLHEAGFATSSKTGTIDILRKSLHAGIPVICLLDQGIGPYRRPHYVTVIGLDDTAGWVIYHDGLTANRTASRERFLQEWERAGYWMVIATALPGERSEHP